MREGRGRSEKKDGVGLGFGRRARGDLEGLTARYLLLARGDQGGTFRLIKTLHGTREALRWEKANAEPSAELSRTVCRAPVCYLRDCAERFCITIDPHNYFNEYVQPRTEHSNLSRTDSAVFLLPAIHSFLLVNDTQLLTQQRYLQSTLSDSIPQRPLWQVSVTLAPSERQC